MGWSFLPTFGRSADLTAADGGNPAPDTDSLNNSISPGVGTTPGSTGYAENNNTDSADDAISTYDANALGTDPGNEDPLNGSIG